MKEYHKIQTCYKRDKKGKQAIKKAIRKWQKNNPEKIKQYRKKIMAIKTEEEKKAYQKKYQEMYRLKHPRHSLFCPRCGIVKLAKFKHYCENCRKIMYQENHLKAVKKYNKKIKENK